MKNIPLCRCEFFPFFNFFKLFLFCNVHNFNLKTFSYKINISVHRIGNKKQDIRERKPVSSDYESRRFPQLYLPFFLIYFLLSHYSLLFHCRCNVHCLLIGVKSSECEWRINATTWTDLSMFHKHKWKKDMSPYIIWFHIYEASRKGKSGETNYWLLRIAGRKGDSQ